MPYTDIHNSIPYQREFYTRNIVSPKVGFSSAQYRNLDQEDRLCVDIVPVFYFLDHARRIRVLELAFQKIASDITEKFPEEAKKQGTTAVITISFLEKKEGQIFAHIYTASLGDSCAYYLIRDKSTNKVRECARLHNIHDLKNKDERARIVKAGGSIIEKDGGERVQGKIAVTRALGDLEWQPYIASIPEINNIYLPVPNGCEIVVLNASDGVNALKTANSVELQGSDTDTLTHCCDEKSFDQLPESIVTSQHNGDNSTTVMHQLDPAEFETIEPVPVVVFPEPVLVGVFDGHGGSLISDYVAKTLPTLINEYSFQAMPDSDDKVKMIAALNTKQSKIIRDIQNNRHKESITKIVDHDSKIRHIKDISHEIKAQFPLFPIDEVHRDLRIQEFNQMLEKMNEVLDAKVNIDIHNNTKSDKYLLFKDNSNSWQELVKDFRTYALDALKKIVDTYKSARFAEAFLRKYRDNPVFSQHRANHWFQKIGRTSAVVEIDKLIERYQRPLLPTTLLRNG